MKHIKLYEEFAAQNAVDEAYAGFINERVSNWYMPVIINRLIKEFGIKPSEINDGHCYSFAKKLHNHIISNKYGNDKDTIVQHSDSLGNKENFKAGQSEDNYHAWVLHKEKCYDSDTPNGVSYFYELSIFKANEGIIKDSGVVDTEEAEG